MAKMIPSYITEDVKSNAEKKVFRMFEEAPGTDSWIVLHSLSLPRHEKLIIGEIDFLVIAPNLGIYALEVKGGRISTSDGIWTFTNRFGESNTKSRSPFKQASDGMFSVIKYLEENLSFEYRNLLFGYGVIFPDIDFDDTDIEFERWSYCNKGDLENGIDEFIRKLSKHTSKKWNEKYGNFSSEKYPSIKQTKIISGALRKEFDRPILSSSIYNEVEKSLINLTNEQYRVLDATEDNARILCRGQAGTGKTLLAIKEAIRSASTGEKVALLCYNKNLALNYDSFPELHNNENIRFVGTIHKYMLNLLGDKADRLDMDDPETYSVEIPLLCADSIGEDDQIDKLIIDEGQDIISESYLLFYDAILRKGFARGKWAIFGDFENQRLYETAGAYDSINLISENASGFVNLKLQTNCRNTKKIGKGFEIMAGVPVEKYLSKSVDGPDIEYYAGIESDIIIKISNIIDELISEKVPPRNITILSPNVYSKSCINSPEMERFNVEQYSPQLDSITFSTIHSFKGLDNQVILLVDVNDYASKTITYVGYSRARVKLYIFESHQARKQRERIIVDYIKEQSNGYKR